MSGTTYLRMLGYSATIVMHVGNIIFLNYCLKREKKNDPELIKFSELQPRYFTIWTFSLQILHAIVGLVLDYLSIANAKDKLYKPPKHLKGFKDTLFSAILWPSTWVVFSVFWSLFLYQRDLIYPAFADKVVTPISNHIMHSGVVLWEVAFQPRLEPASHKKNLLHLTFHLAFYFAVLFYTYIEHDIWIYPIFAVLYGTMYFPLIPAVIYTIALALYYVQWPLTAYFWGTKQKTVKTS